MVTGMNDNIQDFIKKYSKAISEGNAAIFAGAGLSIPSGYVNWSGLIKDFAEEIHLDVNKEKDLIEVIQFYCNSKGGRGAVNDAIYDKFTKKAKSNINIQILSKLPISTYWTTNYDKIIENELEKAGKIVDIKIVPESLALTKSNRDAILYKMHGDCDNPSECILTKDDYESYNINRQLFTTALQGDLVSKTFLFIGFSFDDPNLRYILSRIILLLGENRREHYFFTKKLSKADCKPQKDYSYYNNRRNLQINDLLRYGIRAVEIEDFSEIPYILNKVSMHVYAKKVFVAGSCRYYGEWDKESAFIFMSLLGHKLVENGFSVHTGMIEGVGPQIINGVLSAISENKLQIDKFLRITTLPLINGDDSHIDIEAKRMFQNNMISETGIVIFLFGNQYYDGVLKSSKGVLHDYYRAKEQNKYMIPVGSTGFAAQDILLDMKSNREHYSYLNEYWDVLQSEKNPDKLSDIVIDVIRTITASI